MSESIVEQTEQQVEPDDSGFTRRGFVKVAVGGMACVYAGAIAYPVYRYLETPVEREAAESAIKEIDLKDADKLPENSTLMFAFGSKPAMLIHFTGSDWVALSAVCAHLGCTLHYQPPAPRIVCACHGGQYDPHTGQNVAGPPPHGLAKYKVSILPGKVNVSKV